MNEANFKYPVRGEGAPFYKCVMCERTLTIELLQLLCG